MSPSTMILKEEPPKQIHQIKTTLESLEAVPRIDLLNFDMTEMSGDVFTYLQVNQSQFCSTIMKVLRFSSVATSVRLACWLIQILRCS